MKLTRIPSGKSLALNPRPGGRQETCGEQKTACPVLREFPSPSDTDRLGGVHWWDPHLALSDP